MGTNQPVWKLIANLGDRNPIDYGGYFVYRDTTGVYTEEAEMLIAPDNDDGAGTWQVYRFILDKCTWRKSTGTLSDNKFHPEMCAWFAQRESARKTRPQDTSYLSGVASSIGTSLSELRALFCSDNPLDRAHAYRAIGDYHGYANLDSYPVRLTSRTEVEARYAAELAKAQS